MRDNLTVGLSDFGEAFDLNNELARARVTFKVGTPYYAAPEAIIGEEAAIRQSADLWSFSIVMLECVTSYLNKAYLEPEFFYENSEKKKALDPVVLAYGGFDAPSLDHVGAKIAEGWRPTISPAVMHHCPEVAALVTECWAHDPDSRPTSKQVLKRLHQIGDLGSSIKDATLDLRSCDYVKTSLRDMGEIEKGLRANKGTEVSTVDVSAQVLSSLRHNDTSARLPVHAFTHPTKNAADCDTPTTPGWYMERSQYAVQNFHCDLPGRRSGTGHN